MKLFSDFYLSLGHTRETGNMASYCTTLRYKEAKVINQIIWTVRQYYNRRGRDRLVNVIQ